MNLRVEQSFHIGRVGSSSDTHIWSVGIIACSICHGSDCGIDIRSALPLRRALHHTNARVVEDVRVDEAPGFSPDGLVDRSRAHVDNMVELCVL